MAGATGDSSDDMLKVITQLRKSQVADPLLLALTPKTGGEPYGVGPDVIPDDFLAEEKSVKCFAVFLRLSFTCKYVVLLSVGVADCRRSCQRCR